jgi:hypothetical protein
LTRQKSGGRRWKNVLNKKNGDKHLELVVSLPLEHELTQRRRMAGQALLSQESRVLLRGVWSVWGGGSVAACVSKICGERPEYLRELGVERRENDNGKRCVEV